jgi:omega-6 fatty acid desaturase (delta-12 desaturase)
MTTTIPERFTDASIGLINTDLKLRDIIKTLPKDCFKKNPRKAWSSVLLSITAVSLGYSVIAYVPWFLLPLAWIFTGTALTGFFVIAHDCGHRSFAKQLWLNDWLGHIMLLPLIYPFHSWRILHNRHHAHTNKLMVDNAWHPWVVEDYVNSNRLIQRGYRLLRGRLWWLSSIVHWAGLHFNPSQVSKREQPKVKLSVAVVGIFAVVFFPTLFMTMGVWGVIKFWFVPWLVFHFWLSTFTIVHHTDAEVQFRPIETWNEVESQVAGTVHCDYPRWVEILCHDINVHVPHHVCMAIPSYNLRLAHASLEANWGEYIPKRRFSWSLIKDIVDRCHLYHPEQAYLSFAELQRNGTGKVEV